MAVLLEGKVLVDVLTDRFFKANLFHFEEAYTLLQGFPHRGRYVRDGGFLDAIDSALDGLKPRDKRFNSVISGGGGSQAGGFTKAPYRASTTGSEASVLDLTASPWAKCFTCAGLRIERGTIKGCVKR